MIGDPSVEDATAGMRDRAVEIVNYALTIAYIVLGTLCSVGLLLAPSLHESNSMKLVAGLGIPWSVWAAIYLLYAVLLTRRSWRLAGWYLGTCLTAFWLASYIASILAGNPASAPGLLAGGMAVLSQVSGGARTIIAVLAPGGGPRAVLLAMRPW